MYFERFCPPALPAALRRSSSSYRRLFVQSDNKALCKCNLGRGRAGTGARRTVDHLILNTTVLHTLSAKVCFLSSHSGHSQPR